jgi:hypothetical protein
MNGVLHIAFGRKFIDQASFSAQSLKLRTDIDVTIFCDEPPEHPVFDNHRIIKPTHKRCKVDYIYQSPYERTLYLDSDTKVVFDISDLFDLFARFDVCGAQDYARKSSRWFSIGEYKDIPYAFPEYNGGVMGFRKSDRSKEFFALWKSKFHQYYAETNGQDQASLRIALWNSDIALGTLPPEYNVRSAAMRDKVLKRRKNTEDRSMLEPRILHWHGLEQGKISAFRKKYKPMPY